MNTRRRAIRRAARRSLYWSTAWRVAAAAVQRGELVIVEIMDGLPPEVDRAKLRLAIDTLAAGLTYCKDADDMFRKLGI